MGEFLNHLTEQEIVERLRSAPVVFPPLDEPIPNTFGGLLEAYRERTGIPKATLARRSGLTTSYIHSLVDGKELPRLGAAYILAINLFLTPQERENFATRAGANPNLIQAIEKGIKLLPT